MENPFGTTGTGEKDGSSEASSGGGGGRRGNIHVAGIYGTKTYSPDTKCQRCNRRAVGVWIKGEPGDTTAENRAEPLCGNHRDMVKKSQEQAWKEGEFRRFVD